MKKRIPSLFFKKKWIVRKAVCSRLCFCFEPRTEIRSCRDLRINIHISALSTTIRKNVEFERSDCVARVARPGAVRRGVPDQRLRIAARRASARRRRLRLARVHRYARRLCCFSPSIAHKVCTWVSFARCWPTRARCAEWSKRAIASCFWLRRATPRQFDTCRQLGENWIGVCFMIVYSLCLK